MINSKSQLRKQFLVINKTLSNERKTQAQKAALKYLKKIKYKKILSFSSKPNEINLWPLNEYLSSDNRLLLPKIQDDKLLIFEVKNLQNALIKNKFNIYEPDVKKCKLFDISKISCVLVPAVAFDQMNNRLGYGMGFYDKFLSQIKCHFFGIGFKEQLTKELPLEAHDVKLDKLYLF